MTCLSVRFQTGASGFTVAISQWNSAVSSQCFQTAFEYSDPMLSVSSMYPTQSTKTFTYRIDEGFNGTETGEFQPAMPEIFCGGFSSHQGMLGDRQAGGIILKKKCLYSQSRRMQQMMGRNL